MKHSRHVEKKFMYNIYDKVQSNNTAFIDNLILSIDVNKY